MAGLSNNQLGFGGGGSGGGGGGGTYAGPSPSTVGVNNLPAGSVLTGASYDTLFGYIFAPTAADANWIFYNGTYVIYGTVVADFSTSYTIISVVELFWFLCTTNTTVLIGTTPGGSDIGFIQLSANVASTLRIDVPVQNGTVLYFTGVTSGGGSLQYKSWLKY